MPRPFELLWRSRLVRSLLFGVVCSAIVLAPYRGSSWDEPTDEASFSAQEAELLFLLGGNDYSSMYLDTPGVGDAVPTESFVLAGEATDCVQLWRAYVHAIVQVEIAQANLAKVQAAVEKCLERRKASASSAAVEPTNALFELSGDPLFSVAGDENPAVEYSVLD